MSTFKTTYDDPALGRDLSGATGLVLFIAAFATIVGLKIAATGREQLAILDVVFLLALDLFGGERE